MTTRQRVFTYIAASVGVLVLGWMVLIGSVYLLGGVATVQIVEHDQGFRLHLPIPMALIHAATATSEVFFMECYVGFTDCSTITGIKGRVPLPIFITKTNDNQITHFY